MLYINNNLNMLINNNIFFYIISYEIFNLIIFCICFFYFLFSFLKDEKIKIDNIIIIKHNNNIILWHFFFIGYYIFFNFFFLIEQFNKLDLVSVFFFNSIKIESNSIFLFILLSIIYLFIISQLFQEDKIHINELVFFVYMIYFFTKVLIVSFDFINIFISMESISLIICILIKKNNNILSSEASLKYFIFSSIFSILFLVGLYNILILIGSTNLEDFYNILKIKEVYNNIDINLYISIFFIYMVIFFKLGVVPFHFWILDVYQGSSFFTLSIIGSIPKIGFMYIFFNLFFFNIYFYYLLYFIIIISLIFSIILGLVEFNIKRLLGISSIYNIALCMVGLLLNQKDISFFMLINYIFTNLNIIFIFIFIKKYYIVNKFFNIYDLKNLFLYNVNISLLLSINLFNLIGLPPLINFFSKIEILSSLIINKNYLLLIIIIFTSIVSCFYYLNLIQKAYIIKLNEKKLLEDKNNNNFYLLFIIYILTFIIFFFQLFVSDILIFFHFFK